MGIDCFATQSQIPQIYLFSWFFFSVVESHRLFSIRAAAKTSELGFDDAGMETDGWNPSTTEKGF